MLEFVDRSHDACLVAMDERLQFGTCAAKGREVRWRVWHAWDHLEEQLGR
jgi:hypothetical protein